MAPSAQLGVLRTQAHGTQHIHQPLPQHRHRRPCRCRQDHHHRTGAVLHRPVAQDRRGPRRRCGDGLDGAGAGTRHHHHLGGHHMLLGGHGPAVPTASRQHHRHARPCRLHHRSGTLAARPGRRGGGVLRHCRRRAAVGNGVAAGESLRSAAHRLRQQDGPRRRGLPARGRADQGAPGLDARSHAARHRRRGELPRRPRPRAHEGDLLERRGSRPHLHHGGPSRRDGRRGRADARGTGRMRRRGERRADGEVPRRRRAQRGRDSHRDQDSHAGQRNRSGAVRLGVQEQGRAGHAGRRDRLLASAYGSKGHRRQFWTMAKPMRSGIRTTTSRSRRWPSRWRRISSSAPSPSSASTPAC